MSERAKKALGICMLVCCLNACIIPMTLSGNKTAKHYRAADDRGWTLQTIATEHNGEICVNQAQEDQLQRLPGIGQVYASRIISEREKNGAYYYPEDLESVSGIGPQTLRKIRQMIDMRLNESGD